MDEQSYFFVGEYPSRLEGEYVRIFDQHLRIHLRVRTAKVDTFFVVLTQAGPDIFTVPVTAVVVREEGEYKIYLPNEPRYQFWLRQLLKKYGVDLSGEKQ